MHAEVLNIKRRLPEAGSTPIYIDFEPICSESGTDGVLSQVN